MQNTIILISKNVNYDKNVTNFFVHQMFTITNINVDNK